MSISCVSLPLYPDAGLGEQTDGVSAARESHPERRYGCPQMTRMSEQTRVSAYRGQHVFCRPSVCKPLFLTLCFFSPSAARMLPPDQGEGSKMRRYTRASGFLRATNHMGCCMKRCNLLCRKTKYERLTTCVGGIYLVSRTCTSRKGGHREDSNPISVVVTIQPLASNRFNVSKDP